jgi:hypothetical protein
MSSAFSRPSAAFSSVSFDVRPSAWTLYFTVSLGSGAEIGSDGGVVVTPEARSITRWNRASLLSTYV